MKKIAIITLIYKVDPLVKPPIGHERFSSNKNEISSVIEVMQLQSSFKLQAIIGSHCLNQLYEDANK